MKVSLLFAISVLSLMCIAAPASAQTVEPAPAPLGIVVERFQAATACVAFLPGATEGKFVTFTGAETVTALEFSPGAVQANGKSIEFHGHEEAFLDSTYDGSIRVPNAPGRSVDATLEGTVSGAVNCSGTGVIENLELGNNFSERNMDMQVGDSDTARTQIEDYESSVVPELEGEDIVVYSSREVTSIDSANGVMTMEMKGTITVTARRTEGFEGDGGTDPLDESHKPGSGLGGLLLVLGLLGSGGLFLSNLRS